MTCCSGIVLENLREMTYLTVCPTLQVPLKKRKKHSGCSGHFKALTEGFKCPVVSRSERFCAVGCLLTLNLPSMEIQRITKHYQEHTFSPDTTSWGDRGGEILTGMARKKPLDSSSYILIRLTLSGLRLIR